MKLVLSQYLRTLRERDEFDRLLPDLANAMGYQPLVKPKAGIRQYGVDFPAAGASPKDGTAEFLMFVIKQGDITRRVWSGDPNAVRESMEEIFDVYLRSHVPPAYRDHRKVIVLATTGDLSQDVQPNWAGFAASHPDVSFEFWGADHVAELLELHLLDENLFDAKDRGDLRKSLALAGDSDYQFNDFCQLMLRQLGLNPDGTLSESGATQGAAALVKAIRRVHLAARVCAYWAGAEGEQRQAVWVLERAVLWVFHRALLQSLHEQAEVLQELWDIWRSYVAAGQRYYDRVLDHLAIRDGLSGYCREGAEYAVVLFEHVGLLATIGLAQTAVVADESEAAQVTENGRTVAQALAALLRNHPATGSPRLDRNVIDICLGLVLFTMTGLHDAAESWLIELAGRLNFVFCLGRNFPVGTDSLDDLVELDVDGDDAVNGLLKQTSWMLATIASWCAMLGLDEAYERLAQGHAKDYPEVGAQLWHPAPDWSERWYFGPAHVRSGISEAPYPLPPAAGELRARVGKFNVSARLRWEENSPAMNVGLWALDFVACRHFQTPVPASMWYRIEPRSPPGAAPQSHSSELEASR